MPVQLHRSQAAALVVVLVAAGMGSWLVVRRPETTAAMRGQEIARRLGCFACHGPGGTGGILDPASQGGSVPGWEGGHAAAYVRQENDVREWILYGTLQDQAAGTGGEIAGGLVPMPAYEGLVDGQELDDLVAYFLAVSGWDPQMPDSAHEGRKVALRMGCFGCHGPSGMGGTPNPGSFKGHIPAWDGHEFAALVRDEGELREWILDGRPRRLWEHPVARRFLESQKVQMPAYRQYLSDDELDKLVAYVTWLREP